MPARRYLSADFPDQATGALAAGLFEAQTDGYDVGLLADSDDGSKCAASGAAFPHWRDLRA